MEAASGVEWGDVDHTHYSNFVSRLECGDPLAIAPREIRCA
jgi:hypothetical protein